MFVCRWQNGDFSAVTARSREEGLELVSQPVCLRLTMARNWTHNPGQRLSLNAQKAPPPLAHQHKHWSERTRYASHR